MDERAHVKRLIEGLLFVSGQPMPLKRLQQAAGGLDAGELRACIDELNQQYAQTPHALRIQEIAGGFQLVTDPELAPVIKKALTVPKDDVFSKAAMETLAIIAYRQPLTKAEIELIRGVDVSGTLETLLERQFVRVMGRKDTPGRPLLYGTTIEFLRHLGLKDANDLPALPAGVNLSEALRALPAGLAASAASAQQEPPSAGASFGDVTTVAQSH